MDNLAQLEIKLINAALDRFENIVKSMDQDSPEAYALTIFVNACCDTDEFQSNRYSALVHFPHARTAASQLVELLKESESAFKMAVSRANQIMSDYRVVHSDLCFG